MIDLLTRVVENFFERINGPLTLRFVLQPAMAALVGFRAGLEDARVNRPAYFWAIVVDPAHRRSLLREGWKDVALIFGAALVLDIAYQIIAFRWVYPGEAVAVALLLAVVPYCLVRGPVNRIRRAIRFNPRKE